MSQRQPNDEERQRMINDCINNAFDPNMRDPVPLTPEQQLVEKFKKVTLSVIARTRGFIKSVGHDKAMENRAGLRQMIADMYIEEFRKFDKEEILFMLCMMHVETVFEQL